MTNTGIRTRRTICAAMSAIVALQAAGAVGSGYTPPPTQWGYIVGCVMLAAIGTLTLIGARAKATPAARSNVAIGIVILGCSVACGIAAYTFG